MRERLATLKGIILALVCLFAPKGHDFILAGSGTRQRKGYRPTVVTLGICRRCGKAGVR